MKPENLLRAIGELDDALISAAAHTRKEENLIMMNTGKARSVTRRIAVLAAVAATLTALAVTAYATDVFGIKSRVMEADSWFGPEAAVISLVGGPETPDYTAAEEWEAFKAEYLKSGKVDPDSLKTGYATAGDARRAGAYFFYGCQDVTMIETLQDIADRYGLKLHTERTSAQRLQTLLDAGIGNIFPAGEEYVGYFYEDGSYKMESIGNADESASATRTVKGTMAPYSAVISDVDTYVEEEYTTACGVAVQLMFSEAHRRGIAMYETETSIFTLNLLSFSELQPKPGEEIFSMNTLKAAVDCYDLTRLDG